MTRSGSKISRPPPESSLSRLYGPAPESSGSRLGRAGELGGGRGKRRGSGPWTKDALLFSFIPTRRITASLRQTLGSLIKIKTYKSSCLLLPKAKEQPPRGIDGRRFGASAEERAGERRTSSVPGRRALVQGVSPLDVLSEPLPSRYSAPGVARGVFAPQGSTLGPNREGRHTQEPV